MSLSLFYDSPTIPGKVIAQRWLTAYVRAQGGSFQNKMGCCVRCFRCDRIPYVIVRIRIILYINHILSSILCSPSKIRAFITLPVVCFLPAVVRSLDYILVPRVLVYLNMAVFVPICVQFLRPSYNERPIILVPNVRHLNAPLGRNTSAEYA